MMGRAVINSVGMDGEDWRKNTEEQIANIEEEINKIIWISVFCNNWHVLIGLFIERIVISPSFRYTNI